jgi:hypothetical protein
VHGDRRSSRHSGCEQHQEQGCQCGLHHPTTVVHVALRGSRTRHSSQNRGGQCQLCGSGVTHRHGP